MLTLEERLKICRTCSERAFDAQRGLFCGKTGEKPAFVNNCYDYKADEHELERKSAQEEEFKNKPEIRGFLAFFVFWVIPMSLLVTIISSIVNWNNSNIFMTLFLVSFLLFYTYFQIYTVYGFVHKKPDVVFIAKYQLAVLAVLNLLVILMGWTEYGNDFVTPISLIVSIAWAVIFFTYLCLSDDVKYLIPKETRKLSGLNKILIILSIVVPVTLYIFALFSVAKQQYGATRLSSPEAQIEAMCQNRTTELPQEVSEGLNWIDMYVEDGNVVYSYEYNDEISEQFLQLDNDYLQLTGLYRKEIVRSMFENMSYEDDPLFKMIRNAGYGLAYEYKSTSGEVLYSCIFSNEECSRMFADDYVYSTSESDMQAILESYNNFLPIDYVDGAILKACEVVDDEMHFSLELKDVSNGDLAQLTSRSLKEYMLSVIPYFTDAPITLSRMNRMELVYEFSADCNSWWNMSARISSDEYKNLGVQE